MFEHPEEYLMKSLQILWDILAYVEDPSAILGYTKGDFNRIEWYPLYPTASLAMSSDVLNGSEGYSGILSRKLQDVIGYRETSCWILRYIFQGTPEHLYGPYIIC